MLKDYKFDEFLDLLDDGKINPSDHAAEINSWGDTELEDAKDSVTRYGFTLSNEFLKEILLQNMKLAYEVATGGISDTCCREYLVDEICRMLGLPSYPTYGDSVDKQADFQSKISTLNVSGLTTMEHNMTNATYVTVERNILEVNYADTSFETLSRKRTFTDTADVVSYLTKNGILVDENNVKFL